MLGVWLSVGGVAELYDDLSLRCLGLHLKRSKDVIKHFVPYCSLTKGQRR